MALTITRCPENPLVWPGKWAWRMRNACNPGALYENGRFYLYERFLRPHTCQVELLESEDGIHFRHVSDRPALSPELIGYSYGSVQDPCVVRNDGTISNMSNSTQNQIEIQNLPKLWSVGFST
jgi:beta-1,2-mannobiose phosphorylase / 1,2-beta-oligomannan phosphorylase